MILMLIGGSEDFLMVQVACFRLPVVQLILVVFLWLKTMVQAVSVVILGILQDAGEALKDVLQPVVPFLCVPSFCPCQYGSLFSSFYAQFVSLLALLVFFVVMFLFTDFISLCSIRYAKTC